jgi:hypothetical protein
MQEGVSECLYLTRTSSGRRRMLVRLIVSVSLHLAADRLAELRAC